MKKLSAIGEALIDFIPEQRGCVLQEVEGFRRRCGGAPANVAAVCGKLEIPAQMIGCVGADAFGGYICDVLQKAGVDTEHISQTKAANTTLAFVSLKEDGDREFMFYRRPGADMLLSEEDLCEEMFRDTGILHFCSVGLVEGPSKYAHKKAIQLVSRNGGLISFDPNIRLPLWESPSDCHDAVWEFLPSADLLKISDEELDFITGKKDITEALPELFAGRVKMVLYSKGKGGASLYTKTRNITVVAPEVNVADTTGAGDAMIGSFLACLIKDGIAPKDLERLPVEALLKYLEFSAYYASHSVTNKGAIEAYADKNEITKFIKEYENKR